MAKNLTAENLNTQSKGSFPGTLGIECTAIDLQSVKAEMPVTPKLLAPNGYLHAGSVVSLADSCCGYGCLNNLPDSALGFTTIELKSNHLGTAREGTVECIATPVHLGRSTQVWDATVSIKGSDKVIALFRCTQMVLY